MSVFNRVELPFAALRVLALGVLAALVAGCDKPEAFDPPAPEVGIITARLETLPLRYSYSARTAGEREIEVRARVGGILQERLYREGEYVEAGTPLFRIDPETYRMAVRSAEGRLGVAQAQLKAAGPQRERINRLYKNGTVNTRDVEHAEQEYATAQAAVAAAAAELERARLDLAYTDVRAPISGYTGRETRSEGSLIRSDDDTSLLTTMAQSRRLYVNFTVPMHEAQRLREALASPDHKVVVDIEAIGVEPGSISGQIEFIDTRVRPDTGTVAVRATVENGAERLSPGQFVRASLSGLNSQPAIYIPERAILHGADGPFVWKLDERDTAAMQGLTVREGNGSLVAVDGLAVGDRVVVDGILKVAPGAVVKPGVDEVSTR